MRKHYRNLEESGNKFAFEWVTSGDPEQLMNKLFELHALRWQDKAHKETEFMKEDSKGFHLDLARSLMAKNLLRLSTLKVGGEYAAIFYGYVYKHKYYSIQHGIDPKWDEYSPGHLVRRFAIQKSIEEGLVVFDLMKGRQAHKLRYASDMVYNVSLYIALSSAGRGFIFRDFYTAFKIWVRDRLFRGKRG